MSLSMSGSAFHDWVLEGFAGFLGCFGDAVEITAQGDDRAAAAPTGHPGRGNAGYAFFHVESIFSQDGRDIFGCFYFLETQLAKAEDHVHHFLYVFFFGGTGKKRLLLSTFDNGRV